MKKRGRKCLYETTVKPRFPEIREWLQSGATEKQIADNLGIACSTFYRYKAEKKEFAELIKNGRQALILQLRGAIVKRAIGFTYTEKKRYKKKDETGVVCEYEEETERQALPDVAALNLCLKNYDSENWANDPQALEMKEKELQLRREIAESSGW